MIYILGFIFALGCIFIGIRILREFKDGFDWFSAALYFIIFLVACGLLYVLVFGTYFAITGQ